MRSAVDDSFLFKKKKSISNKKLFKRKVLKALKLFAFKAKSFLVHQKKNCAIKALCLQLMNLERKSKKVIITRSAFLFGQLTLFLSRKKKGSNRKIPGSSPGGGILLLFFSLIINFIQKYSCCTTHI